MVTTPLAMTPNIKLAPGAVVCAESDLRGDITIGAKTVIHPKAQVKFCLNINLRTCAEEGITRGGNIITGTPPC